MENEKFFTIPKPEKEMKKAGLTKKEIKKISEEADRIADEAIITDIEKKKSENNEKSLKKPRFEIVK